MSSARFKAFASVMIAVVTVLGAAAVCLASVAANQAGNADFDGVTASIKAQEATMLSEITTYEHYRAYTTYYRYNELGNLIYDESLKPEADADRITALGELQRQVWGMATGLQYNFFPPRYLNPDGTYNTQREFDEELAEAAQRDELNPDSYFQLSDSLRTKGMLFAGVLIVLAVAFWFFNAAEITNNRAKFFFAAVGILLTLGSIVASLAVQFFF
ncbi:MAG TPA: hypothetical protein VI451_19335 [Anaerolineales bacterium]|nr:hypothetical protein [Anaerolineales bacterium]